MDTFNILFIGDIFAKPGRETFIRYFPELKNNYKIDFTIANCENAAHCSGVTQKIVDSLLEAGVDVLTSGNHFFNNKEIFKFIKEYSSKLLRPANYPPGVPGEGFTLIEKNKFKIAVINLIGRIFMEENFDCPFRKSDEILKQLQNLVDIIIIDFHAEATSEKMALAWYLDGRVQGVIGTHTHIQTADERILPKKTAYITDAGMTGSQDSIIGLTVENTLTKFLYQLPIKFEPASDNVYIQGVILKFDNQTKFPVSIERLNIPVQK